MAEVTAFNINKIYWAIEQRIERTSSFKKLSKVRREGIIAGLMQAKNIIYNETLIKDPRK